MTFQPNPFDPALAITPFVTVYQRDLSWDASHYCHPKIGTIPAKSADCLKIT